MRENRWWWIIRLDEVTTSIGVVIDNNTVTFDDPKVFFQEQITNDVQLSKMLEKAEMGDVKHIESVPYVSEHLFSKGIALIGESGAFIDPLISPGLELISQQSICLAELLVKDKAEIKFNEKAWNRYNKRFLKAYAARIKMYEAGYSFMQSFDIFTTWLMLGNVKYFSGVVYPSILFPRQFKHPLSFNRIELLGLNFLIKRLKKIHTKRIKQGRISQTSASTLRYSGVRIPTGFAFYFVPFKLIKNALVGYVRLELIEFRHLLSKSN